MAQGLAVHAGTPVSPVRSEALAVTVVLLLAVCIAWTALVGHTARKWMAEAHDDGYHHALDDLYDHLDRSDEAWRWRGWRGCAVSGWTGYVALTTEYTCRLTELAR